MMKKRTILSIFFMVSVFSGCRNTPSITVATAIPALESILREMTDKSTITVCNPIPSDISLAELPQFLAENSHLLDSCAGFATAVADIRSVMPQETLYPRLRRRNIRIVEIDCATPLDVHTSAVGLIRNGTEVNPFIWLSISNILKMAAIAAKDLESLSPADSAIIHGNLQKLKKRYSTLKNNYDRKYSTIERFEAVTMNDTFDYLLKDINLFITHQFPADESAWQKETFSQFENGLKNGTIHTIVHRWKPAGRIEELCAQYNVVTAVLTAGDIKSRQYEKGLYGLTENNLSTLLAALTLKKNRR